MTKKRRTGQPARSHGARRAGRRTSARQDSRVLPGRSLTGAGDPERVLASGRAGKRSEVGGRDLTDLECVAILQRSSAKIRLVPIESLRPYAENPRTHSREQVAELAAAIRRYGVFDPLAFHKKHGIGAGEGRFRAAELLGMPKVPIIDASHLSLTEFRAFVVAHNRLSERSGWDREKLGAVLADVAAQMPELPTGFSDAEAKRLLASLGTPQLEAGKAIAFESKGKVKELGVMVVAGDVDEQREIYERLKAGGYRCRIMTS